MSRPATGMPVNAAPSVIPGKVIETGTAATLQDLPFAILFLLTVAGVITTAFALPHFTDVMSESEPSETTASGAVSLNYAIMLQSSVAAATGTVLFSSGWLLLMRAQAKILVTLALIVPIVVCTGLTVWAAYDLAINPEYSVDHQQSVLFLGICGLLGVAFNYCWLQALWHKIPATAQALSLSSHVIFTLPGTVVVAFVSALLQIAWFGVATVAVINAWVELSPTEQEQEAAVAAGEGGSAEAVVGLAMTGMLLALYWGWQVFSNVSYVTTCGSVASWYFFPGSCDRGVAICKPVVFESLGRACTTSFGSICGGSLLVAIVQTIGAIVRYVELKAREDGNLAFVLVACCFRCLFSFIEALLEMFNEWAYVYVAIYGTSFTTAGRAVLRMVNEEGLMTILSSLVADRVVGYGVFFGVLVGSSSGYVATTALHGAQAAVSEDAAFSAWLGVAIASALSFLLAYTCLSPVTAAIRTSLVCFAEAPSVLRTRDEKLHDSFAELQVKPDPNAPRAQQGAAAVGVPVATGVAQPASMV